MRLQVTLVIAAHSLLSLVHAVDPLIHLPYAKYQGTALNIGVTQWLGVRYAASPVGDLRFKPPQDPPHQNSSQDATKFGLPCLATAGSISAIDVTQSEDCLFLNVFAPSAATPSSKLPVFFWMQGGGFNSNANPKVNGSGIIAASDENMVVVTLNYRVGPYGFLADNDQVTPNVGLLDQRKALEWVQKYIKRFGGDPKQVILAGASAGAASVSLHLSAYGGRDDGLFHAAAAESISFATVLTAEESRFQFDNLAIRLGCAGDHALSCIRSKTAAELQAVNINIPYPGAADPPTYLWNPVLDHDLIQDLTYNVFREGNFVKVPVIIGDDTNGGSIFAPTSTSSLAESDKYLKSLFPYMSLEQLGRINDLYPNPNNTCPNTGCYWRQLSDAYGDMRYMCPCLYISSAFTKHGVKESYAYRFNVEDPASTADGYGVQHTIELHAIFGPNYTDGGAPSSYYPGGINANIVPVMQAYWISFIRTLDPNKLRLAGSAKWNGWTDKRQSRIVFETGGETAMESVTKEQQKKCGYIFSIGPGIKQ